MPARDLISQVYLVWRGFTGFGTWADEVGLEYESFGDQLTCLHHGQQISLNQNLGQEDLDELLDVKGVIAGEGPKCEVDAYISGAEYNGKDFCYSFDDEARYHCSTFHVSFDENNRLCLIRIAKRAAINRACLRHITVDPKLKSFVQEARQRLSLPPHRINRRLLDIGVELHGGRERRVSHYEWRLDGVDIWTDRNSLPLLILS